MLRAQSCDRLYQIKHLLLFVVPFWGCYFSLNYSCHSVFLSCYPLLHPTPSCYPPSTWRSGLENMLESMTIFIYIYSIAVQASLRFYEWDSLSGDPIFQDSGWWPPHFPCLGKILFTDGVIELLICQAFHVFHWYLKDLVSNLSVNVLSCVQILVFVLRDVFDTLNSYCACRERRPIWPICAWI